MENINLEKINVALRTMRDNGIFNSKDARFGISLADQSEVKPLTVRQIKAAYRMISNGYSADLTDMGISIPTQDEVDAMLRSMKKAQEDAKAGQPKGWIQFSPDGTVLEVTFNFKAHGFDKALIDKIKSLGRWDRRYDSVRKVWVVSPGQLEKLVDLFPHFEQDEAVKAHLDEIYKDRASSDDVSSMFYEQAMACIGDITAPLWDTGITLYDFQQDGVMWLLKTRKGILGDKMGLGKAQPLDAGILTPTGWKSMGNMAVGDQVIGVDGKPVLVTGVYPQGEKDIYRVTFSDGSSTECCEEHLWTVNTPHRRWRGDVARTLSLAEIRAHGLFSHAGDRQYLIPMVGPVEFDPRPVPLDGYVLGVLLGAGNYPSLHNRTEIISEVEGLLPEGVKLQHSGGKGHARSFRITGDGDPNPVAVILCELGLAEARAEDKFVPDDYKFNTPEVRLAILQGLLDTDGYVSHGNTVQFYSVSQQLAEDVVFLVQSLGGTARLGLKKSPAYTRNSEQRVGLPCYCVTIAIPGDMIPFRCGPKVGRYSPKTKYPPARAIDCIEYVGRKPSQCIRVNAPDGLYVTDDFIVTHNTYQSLVAARSINEVFGFKTIVVAPAFLRNNWLDNIKRIGLKDVEVYTWAKQPEPPEVPFILIADEAHYAQSWSSKRSQAMRKLARNRMCFYAWLLTGTKMKNGKPDNLGPLLEAIDHPVVEDRAAFQRYYCYKPNRFVRRGWSPDGAHHLDELHERIKDSVLERDKKMLGKSLPPKRRILQPVTLSDRTRAEYQATLKRLKEEHEARVHENALLRSQTEGISYWEAVKKAEMAEAIVTINQLRRAGEMAKVEPAVEMALSILEQGDQVVLFACFKDTVHEITRRINAAGYKAEALTGDVVDTPTRRNRTDMWKKRFLEEGVTRALVLIHKAGGVGIDLYSASDVILVGREWTPGDNMQSEDRLHRIGQARSVTSYWLQLDGGIMIDKKIDAALIKKADRIEMVERGKRKTMRGTGGSLSDIAQQFLHDVWDDIDA